MTARARDGTVTVKASSHVAGLYAGSRLGHLGGAVFKVEMP
jgi:crotonobetainyl-CoA:carnitine CoA-transferase CaiB-like acyl-CoA transferase